LLTKQRYRDMVAESNTLTLSEEPAASEENPSHGDIRN
jgi:hypothetical protein